MWECSVAGSGPIASWGEGGGISASWKWGRGSGPIAHRMGRDVGPLHRGIGPPPPFKNEAAKFLATGLSNGT